MTSVEFEGIVDYAMVDSEKRERIEDVRELLCRVAARENPLTRMLLRITDALDLLVADLRLITYAHDSFLQAARDYLRGKSAADYHLRAARVRRARLGATSRWLYQHQKQTFEGAVKLLIPMLPQKRLDTLWSEVQALERRWLSNARKT